MPWRLDLFAGMLMVHGDVESLRDLAITSSHACRSRLLMPFGGGGLDFTCALGGSARYQTNPFHGSESG
jgi:hypothetical protein